MHLKSLTLKGFKSFAQATTFAFEPGVTCIVGPNGSGKSNVVDALAWVMGEQGAKNLRGGSMADVIFAGTATRGPLGRAEVVLTIDNADGALPIEYSEVAISRTLFRDGRSDYAINGDSCRLLDVQELLSDSGLGREMHVIVGQGQLDAVLRASPEERRGFIEEAAGILKHRRRRERTLRKLDSMQANLTRLTDLKTELQRQLKPLGAQAEIAREAAQIQAAVRESRTRLLAIDAHRLAASVAALTAEQQVLETERHLAEDGEQRLETRTAALEREAADDGLDVLRRTALELEGVQQRFRLLAQAAATRVALLASEEEVAAPVGSTAAERAEIEAAISGIEIRAAAAAGAHDAARASLAEAQSALDAVDVLIAADAARVAEHDRLLAGLDRDAATAASRAASAAAEADRRGQAADAARARAERAAAELGRLSPAREEPGEPEPAHAAALGAATAAFDDARTALHALEREQSAIDARLAALRAATAAPPTVAQVLGALPGARRLQDVLDIDAQWRVAIGAVLGPLLDAAVVDDPADSVGRVAALGPVDLVAADATLSAQAVVPGAQPAAEVVRAPDGVRALLRGVFLVRDLAAAQALVADHDVVAVTAVGELVTATRLRTAGSGGDASGANGVELAAERDAAEVAAVDIDGRVQVAQQRLRETRRAQQEARTEQEAADRLARELARASRSAEQRRAALTAAAEAAAAELERAVRQEEAASAARAETAAARDVAAAAAAAARSGDRPTVDGDARLPAAQAVEQAREAVVGARLDAETLRERLRAERERLAAHDARAEAAERAAEAAARRAAERLLHREAAEAVLAEVPAWQASVDGSVIAARVRLSDGERERAEHGADLRAARQRLAAARAQRTDLERRSRDLDMRIYEQQVSLQTVQDRALGQLGLEADALAAERIEGLDRPEEERRLSAAERRLARLGRVNPLALEEFSALEQRHTFLGEQLDDLHRTRADLLTIVDDLDRRMHEIFATAYADTEVAFARIFPVLFPGGSGRLSLTDDGDEPGVEVAVRPAGKKIERLSLLSGGERSLAAVAFLLAIFTARPSPFYILDEVEAALDDANLGRLLDVVSSLRDASQLILITHQKRTMEIADALYGVSMRQDGVSSVIGQRLAART